MLLLVSAIAAWGMSVTLEPSLQDPARIGTEVNLYASVSRYLSRAYLDIASDSTHGAAKLEWFGFR